MKMKELKHLAEKIANLELIIQESSDKKEVQKAQEEIFKLSKHVANLNDIIVIDELVQEILAAKNKNKK